MDVTRAVIPAAGSGTTIPSGNESSVKRGDASARQTHDPVCG
jgi:hypothetical protein